MNVLSLFDGMSCGRIALQRAGIKVDNYYSSEIDKAAIKVANYNWPADDSNRLGDVEKWEEWDIDWSSIDLIIGGTPCQDFSIARTYQKKITGLLGEKSKLFLIFLDILNHVKQHNPDVKFLMENVRMKKDSKEELDNYLGVEGVCINSSLVSYQIRHRYYWTNICNITQPEDKGVSFQDYIEKDQETCHKYKLKNTPSRIKNWAGGVGRNNGAGSANVTNSDKIYCITTKQDRTPNSGLVEFEDFCRFLTRKELEIGQTVPVGYTDCVSYNQACKVLGNGWTVDVIVHILKNLK